MRKQLFDTYSLPLAVRLMGALATRFPLVHVDHEKRHEGYRTNYAVFGRDERADAEANLRVVDAYVTGYLDAHHSRRDA